MSTFIERLEAGEYPVGIKVLVVDKDKQWLALHGRMLSELRYEVTTCSNGKDALELLEEEHDTFELIFMDVNIPDMHFTTMLKHIEDMEIPTIVTFGDHDKNPSLVMEGIRHGASDFINKPMTKAAVEHLWHHAAKKKYYEGLEAEVTRFRFMKWEPGPSWHHAAEKNNSEEPEVGKKAIL